MTNSKATKKALFMSVMSLLLCFTMLMGATFAWFTDTVTSTNNIIKSGTLDVEMYWAEGKADPNAAATAWTDASTGAIFNNDLWEPGYTEVRHIKIENKGSLALKYQLNILANGDVSELADVIDVYFVDPAQQVPDRTALDGITPEGTLTQILAGMPGNASGDLIAGESDTVTIALKMREEAGNEYQDKAIGSDFVVQLLATQLSYERDSFDELYDQNSEYHEVNESASITNNAGKLGSEVVLTAEMPYGTMKVTVPAGAQLSSNDVSDLKLTVKKVDANESVVARLSENQVATGYEIYVNGVADYINPYVSANGSKMYNYSDIKVELPIGAGRNDVSAYKDGTMPSNTWASYDPAAGNVTFSVDYFTPFSQAKKSNITIVYTVLNEAEKQLNEEIASAVASGNGEVSISSTAENPVSVNNIADALSDSTGITLAGEGAYSTTVTANTATITADSLTVKDMTVQSVGTTTIKGNNTTIENVVYQSVGTSYGLTVSGSDTTIKNTTVEGADASQGLVLIASGSDTAASETNVSGLTVTDTSPYGSSSGFVFKNMNGTTNLSNSTIKVKGSAVSFGPSNSTVRGYANVSNSTFDSTSVYISTVKASTFDSVTFDNTWFDSAISFTVGGTTNTFTNCEFKADVDFRSANYANKNVTLTFNNCTYDGDKITAENIKEHFVFNNGTFGLQNRDKLTVIVDGVTVTL